MPNAFVTKLNNSKIGDATKTPSYFDEWHVLLIFFVRLVVFVCFHNCTLMLINSKNETSNIRDKKKLQIEAVWMSRFNKPVYIYLTCIKEHFLMPLKYITHFFKLKRLSLGEPELKKKRKEVRSRIYDSCIEQRFGNK